MARVNEVSVLPATNIYPQVEWTIPIFTPQPQSITTFWPVLIFLPAEGRRLSWCSSIRSAQWCCTTASGETVSANISYLVLIYQEST